MKRAGVGLSVIWFLQFPAAFSQEAPDVNIFVFAQTSCAQWAQSANDPQLRTIYGTWFRGFVSGYNFGNSANQVPMDRMPDSPALFAYIDKYCQDNPLLPFVAAAAPLVQEIREHRVPVGPLPQ